MMKYLSAIMICTTYRFYLYYLKHTARLNMLLWDFKMCTSGDFTVEIDIPEETW